MVDNIPNLWQREIDFMEAVRDMERHGIRVDIARCRHLEAVGMATMNTIQYELGGLNPGSPRDVEKLIIEKAGLPYLPDHPRSKKTQKYSWTKDVMQEYEEIIEARGSDNDVAQKILTFRGWQKTVSSNYRAYQKFADSEGILRPNFKLHGTKTGRLSCADPALQQIPKETEKPWNGQLKKVFIPRPGYVLLGRDYSQLEYRLGAGYANQQNVLEIFNDETRDLFTEMAGILNRSRNDVKTLTYAKTYGAGQAKLELMLGNGARKFIKDWESQHNRMVALSQRVNDTGRDRGYIRLWTGRRRHFDHWKESRKGWNSLLQGGGAEIVKSAMIRCHKEFYRDPDCNLVLQVHDELLFEVKEEKLTYYDLMIKHLMEDVVDEIDFGVKFKTESKIWGQ